MKSLIIAAAIASIITAPALAQDYNASNSAQSQSHSQSGSAINRGGDTVYSSTAIAPSMGTTMPCVVGQSGGIGALGVGVSVGGGKIDKDCIAKQDAAVLRDIARMNPRDPARTATILHLCSNHATLRRSMISLGWCRIAQ